MYHDGFVGMKEWKDVFVSGEDVVLDLHNYWAFGGDMTEGRVKDEVCARGDEMAGFHVPVMVGEWSIATNGIADTNAWQQSFYTSQLQQYMKAAGHTFWSLKANGMRNWSLMAVEDLIGTSAAHGNGDFC